MSMDSKLNNEDYLFLKNNSPRDKKIKQDRYTDTNICI